MASTLIQIHPTTNPPKTLASLQRALILISLPFGILNFVLPVYGKQVGASAVEIGLSFSAFSLMAVLLRPLIGAGLDRYGRRWFLVAGLACYASAMLVFAYSTTVWQLVAARVVQGVAAALLWLAVNAVVADVAGEDQRARSFGGVAQAANQGGMIGTFIGFSVLFPMGIQEGWNPLFIGFAAAGLLSALLAWRQIPETMPVRAQTKGSGQPGKTSSLTVLRGILRSRSLALLMLVGLISGASSALVAPMMMLFLQERFQAGLSQLAWAFFPSALVWTFLPSRMGKLADRFGRKPLIVTALLVAAANSFIIPGAGSLAILAALWVVEAVCFTASDPASQALITDLVSPRERGRVYGLFALAGGLGATIGPLAGGWIYDAISPAAPFIANAIALATCGLILALGLVEKRHQDNQAL